DYLSSPGKGNFFEIQAGMAPTQGHGLIMDAGATLDFVQAFGCMYVEPGSLQAPEWHEAQQTLNALIHQRINGEELEALRVQYAALSRKQPEQLLHMGSGFGALELRRRAAEGKPYCTGGMVFPDSAIGEAELPWLALLEKGALPEAFVDEVPVSYMVQPEWKQLLLASLENPENRHWSALLHLGIMQAEEGDFDAALESFAESMEKQENVWALRNIASIKKTLGDTQGALDCYAQLFTMPAALADRGFAEEYMSLLLATHLYAKAWDFYNTLPETLKQTDRLLLQSGSAAVELGNLEYVEGLLTRDYSVIREGENSTSDIWYRYQAQKLAAARGVPYTRELLQQVMDTMNPPYEMDFRLHVYKKPGQK
nr:tetratricopeptide repeat protein [bacterium]